MDQLVSRITARAIAILALTAIGHISVAFSQDRPAAIEPASEGRPITPSGSLVLDATTGQPAVGSLPVSFVRSPDHAAKDGGGRYLIVVNSGFGIQFNAATNHEQQSVSVLDLNAQPVPQVIQSVYFPSPQSAQVGAAVPRQPRLAGALPAVYLRSFRNQNLDVPFPSECPATCFTPFQRSGH